MSDSKHICRDCIRLRRRLVDDDTIKIEGFKIRKQNSPNTQYRCSKWGIMSEKAVLECDDFCASPIEELISEVEE